MNNASIVEQLKRSQQRVFEVMSNSIRENPNQKKEQKLRSTLRSAYNKRRSLLDDRVAKREGGHLFDEVSIFLKDSDQKNLRWITVIDSLIDFDQGLALKRVKSIEATLKKIVSKANGLKIIGAHEFEIVNFDLVNSYLRQLKHDDVSARAKLHVLQDMCIETICPEEFGGGIEIQKTPSGSKVLVHCHFVADFGDNPEFNINEFSKIARRYAEWAKKPHHLHIESFHKNKSKEQNLKNLSYYMTKGGNPDLRYKLTFSSADNAISLEMMEASIWQDGCHEVFEIGPEGDKSQVLASKSYGFDNMQHLTSGEIKYLNSLIYALMKRKYKHKYSGYMFKFK